jgi:hypothetical protein
MAVVALVVGEAESLVGVDGVEPAVLERISADLVGEADAAPLLTEVEQHAPAAAANDVQRFLELRATIALQGPEHVPSQAFAVQPNQRRLTAERADDKGDMFLPIVGRAEGDDLRRRHVVERQLRAGDDLDGGLLSFPHDVVDRNR